MIQQKPTSLSVLTSCFLLTSTTLVTVFSACAKPQEDAEISAADSSQHSARTSATSEGENLLTKGSALQRGSQQPYPNIESNETALIVAKFLDSQMTEKDVQANFHDALVKSLSQKDGQLTLELVQDLSEMVRSLPEERQRELQSLIAHGSSSSSPELFADMAKQILQRGKVLSEHEYRVLQQYSEQIWDDPDKTEEMTMVNKVLGTFRKSAGH